MREHPRRRRLQVIRHAPPEEALTAMREPATGELPDLLVTLTPDLTAWDAETSRALSDVSRETCSRCGQDVDGGVCGSCRDTDGLPSLSRAQVLRLEALTALWERQVRADGPPADATQLFGAPALPPVPPPAPRAPLAVAFDAVAEVAATAEAMVRATVLPAGGTPGVESRPLEPAGVESVAGTRRVSDWTSRHDPRSLEFAVRARLRTPVPVQDLLLPVGPILDQGTTPPLSVREASGCVGTAVVAAANVLTAGGVTGAPVLHLEDARRVYDRAQHLDQVSGESYAGTSVLAGMKAGQEAGWWDTYLWALGGTRDVAEVLLQLRAPVVIGVPWDSALEDPDAAGVIAPGGRPAGGHALTVVGIRQAVGGRPGPWFALQQSRGPAEGDHGLVYLHHRHLSALLAGRGEAAVPLPRGIRA